MKTTCAALLLLVLLSASLYSQSGNINNTLGTGGTFTVKDGSTTFLTLSQANGYLSLNNSLTLLTTTSSTRGVIFKGGNRFIHDYTPSGTNGYNTFVGVNAGNFTMSGSGSQASYNTAVGAASLGQLSTGTRNSAFGYQALYANSSGGNNSAFGNWALQNNTSAGSNSAFGSYALLYNVSGGSNSAFGESSLRGNISGFGNSAFGEASLFANTTGNNNCAFGLDALVASTRDNNSAFGYQALASTTTGTDNSALGYQSLFVNDTGRYNSAFGSLSLTDNTGGSRNSGLGYEAGDNITTGSNNTCIGYHAEASSATVSNEITLGDGNITALRCHVSSITTFSDARDKSNIRDLDLGIDFLMNVKPRLFNWDQRSWYANGKPDGSKMQATPTAGFIAQELDEVQTREHAEWLNLVLKCNPDRLEATPGNLLPIIVRAIQELKADNDALRAEVQTLRASMAEQVRKELKATLTKAVENNETSTAATSEDTHY